MTYFEYKLQQLTNFLGEKKLKQLGLLDCETCTHIMAHTEGIVGPITLSSLTYLTPNELADINRQFYDSTLLTPNTSYLNSPEKIIENNRITSTKSSYPSSLKTPAQLLTEILLDITTAPSSKGTDLGIGYIYNIYPSSPSHTLACTECNRLYAIAHPTLQLMPLPVRLTCTEYELLKGVYIDVLL